MRWFFYSSFEKKYSVLISVLCCPLRNSHKPMLFSPVVFRRDHVLFVFVAYSGVHILTWNMSNMAETAYSSEHLSSLPFIFFGGSVLLICLVFRVILLCAFTFWVACLDVRYDFRIKQWSVRLHLQLFVGWLWSYLRYLYLLADSNVRYIWCCVYALFLFVLCTYVAGFSGLSIFDCPFGIL